MINDRAGIIPTGLVPSFVDSCFLNGISLCISDQRSRPSRDIKAPRVSLRDYQIKAIEAALGNEYIGTWWPRGVIHAATGSGKTEIAIALTQMIDNRYPKLFVVHRTDLMRQTVNRFKKAGLVVNENTHENKGLVDICVFTFQKLHSEIRNGTSSLGTYGTVFFDEAHMIAADLDKGNALAEISKRLENAYFRFGLTATPFMKDEYSNLLLEGATGQVLYKINNRELIERGYLTEAEVTMFTMNVRSSQTWPACYDEGIVMNRQRNEQIVESFKKNNGPTLIMVNRTGHGELLQSMLHKEKIDIPFADGTTDKNERERILNDLREGKLRGAVCSTIWDEGIDIPNLRTIILAGGGKSMIKNLQRLGRGLRTADDKAKLQVIDFFDSSSRTLKRHSETRKKLWESQGFDVTIV
jgi:superfamily II DNA or RNA helicase